MAVELKNSKKLHVHALPVLMVSAALLIMAFVVVSRSQITVTNGVQALFGQAPTEPPYELPHTNRVQAVKLGQTTTEYFNQRAERSKD